METPGCNVVAQEVLPIFKPGMPLCVKYLYRFFEHRCLCMRERHTILQLHLERSLRSLAFHTFHCAFCLLSGVFHLKHLNQPSHVASEITFESWHLVFEDHTLSILPGFHLNGQSVPIRLLQEWSN